MKIPLEGDDADPLPESAELGRLLEQQGRELAALRKRLESVEKRLHDIEHQPPAGIWPAVGSFD